MILPNPLWDNHASAAKYDYYYFNKFMALVRKEYVRELKKRLEDELRACMLCVMGPEKLYCNKEYSLLFFGEEETGNAAGFATNVSQPRRLSGEMRTIFA